MAGLCLTLCIGWLPQHAWAILNSCTVSASGVGFGAYNPFSGSNLDSTGTVTVSCLGVLGGVFQVALSTGGSGTFSPRRMVSGANTLSYNLYVDSSRTQIWGDGSGGTSIRSLNCSLLCLGIPQNFTVYGRIPASQTGTHSGTYGDTITVTVTF
jgi:spore coat protein U-like protein